METERANCPFCGKEAEPGEMNVSGQFADLEWKACERTPSHRPIRLFGRTFSWHSRKAISLLCASASATFTGFDLSRSAKPIGWYCPNCKKVFAVFDAPDNPQSSE